MDSIPAVICARVSTRGQAEEGASLETQIEIGTREAARRNAHIVAVFRDEGISGAAYLTRPGIQSGLSLLESGAAKMLIVTDVSRAARDVAIASDIRRRVMRAGGILAFADIGIVDATAASGFNFNIHAAAASFFREQTREKSIGGRFTKAREGEQTARWPSPFGYHIVTKADVIRGDYPAADLGHYHTVEAEAVIVREIYARYVAGESLRAIGRDLAERKVKGSWTPTKVRRILASALYRGEATYGKRAYFEDEARLAEGKAKRGFAWRDPSEWVPIPAPAIIAPEVWEEAARLREGARKRRGGNPARVYLLSSLARCPYCGGAVNGATSRTPSTGLTLPYYRCLIVGCPGYGVIGAASAEELVLEGVDRVMRSPEMIDDAVAVWLEADPQDQDEAEAKRVDASLSALADKERGAAEGAAVAIGAGGDPQAFKAVFEAIAAERRELLARRDRLRQRDKGRGPRPGIGDILRLPEEVAAALKDPDGQYPVAVRRRVLGQIVESVTLTRKETDGKRRGGRPAPGIAVALAGRAVVRLRGNGGEQCQQESLKTQLPDPSPAVYLIVTRLPDASISVEVEYR